MKSRLQVGRDICLKVFLHVISFNITTGKKRKHQSELTEVLLCLGELERRAEERAEEREFKRRKFELEMEDKRREAERKHEERMSYMFMTFAREMMGRSSGQQMPQPPPDGFQDIHDNAD